MRHTRNTTVLCQAVAVLNRTMIQRTRSRQASRRASLTCAIVVATSASARVSLVCEQRAASHGGQLRNLCRWFKDPAVIEEVAAALGGAVHVAWVRSAAMI